MLKQSASKLEKKTEFFETHLIFIQYRKYLKELSITKNKSYEENYTFHIPGADRAAN